MPIPNCRGANLSAALPLICIAITRLANLLNGSPMAMGRMLFLLFFSISDREAFQTLAAKREPSTMIERSPLNRPRKSGCLE